MTEVKFSMKKTLLLAAAVFAFSCGQGEAAVQLSLADSVDMALATHENIEMAEAARDAAKWNLSAARRATGFNISWRSEAYRIGGEYYAGSRRNYDRYGGDPYNRTFSNTGTITLPLYSGGRLENNITAGRHGLSAADLTLEDTRQSIRFQALRAYYDLLQKRNLRNVSQSAVNMADEQRGLIQTQYEEGAVAYADVLQMEVQLANYRQGLVSAEGALDSARYTLARVVGLPQDTAIEPTDSFSYEPFAYTLPECEAYALEHRPDGAAAEFRTKQAEAGKNAQKSGWHPQINAAATKTAASDRPFARERTSSDTWEAGVNLSWTVFDNFVTSANVDAAKAREMQYKAQAEGLWNDIRLEVRTDYAQMKAAEQNIRATEEAVKQAEESYAIAQVRYEEGVDILLSVTNAQEKLTQARSNYYTALYNYNLYKAALEKAMGMPVALDVPEYLETVEGGSKK